MLQKNMKFLEMNKINFALNSQEKTQEAINENRFKDELIKLQD